MSLPRITEIAHCLVKPFLRPGDRTVDATVGNGLDTLFLADCVGPRGRVDGFEIQSAALAAARERVGDLTQVVLHEKGHESMEEIVAPGIRAVMFNLGYYPSGDKSIITRPETTRIALSASLKLLGESGILSVVVYPGHDGGDTEASAVEAWFATLDPERHRSVRFGTVEKARRSPYLIAAEVRARN